MYQTADGLMEVRIQHVTFSKVLKGGEILIHHARIITYAKTRPLNTQWPSTTFLYLIEFIGQQ